MILYTSPSRYLKKNNIIQWSWPGFYFEAAFRGTCIFLHMDSAGRSFQLFIDNEQQQIVSRLDGVQPIRLELNSPGPHKLRLQDTSAEWQSIATLYSLEIDGEWLSPPPPRPLFFEFIGDSWTAGWGNLSAHSLQSDCTQSYAALLAKHFGADYSLVAAAGQGIAKNYGEAPGVSVNLAQQANRALPTQPDIWMPARPADWVFVLAGENDHSFPPYPSAELFQRNLRQILADARVRSPQAQIALICVDRPHPNPERIRAAHAAEQADGFNTLLLECPNFSDNYPLGYLWHPGKEHHRELAAQLAAQLNIQRLNGY